jgi:hypothetical protein
VPDNDDIEQRLRTLEVEMRAVRETAATARADAGAARVLASGADRDASEVRAELRAHTSALNALRETQVEQHNEALANFKKLQTGIAAIATLLSKDDDPGDTPG